MAAPLGNQNAKKARLFEQILTRAIAQEDGRRLRLAAEKILDLAVAGERWACEFIRDTTDGKPAQAIDLTGDINHNYVAQLPAVAPTTDAWTQQHNPIQTVQ